MALVGRFGRQVFWCRISNNHYVSSTLMNLIFANVDKSMYLYQEYRLFCVKITHTNYVNAMKQKQTTESALTF